MRDGPGSSASTLKAPRAAPARVADAWHSVICLPRVAANAEVVGQYAGGDGVDTRGRFLRALQDLQPLGLDRHADERDVAIECDCPVADHPALLELLAVDALPSGWRVSGEERTLVGRRIREGLALLEELDADLRSAMRILIGTFLVAKLDGYEGGSRSSVVGAIWLGLSPDRPAVDFAELILHE